ncbi:MAG: VWA domain-containing protein [Succinivibrio sp.]|nr:VWA domain-containing protein [Succinivibrio sp.]
MKNVQNSALPIIVKNYSRAFGIEVKMQGVNAYTNGKIITIPRLNLSDPVISRVAYAYLAHESAHIRYTDFDVVASQKHDFLRFTIFNVLEDARVERLIGREFIGVWENLCLLRDCYCGFDQFAEQIDDKSDFQLLLTLMMNYAACYCQKFKRLRPRTAFLLRYLRQLYPHPFLLHLCYLSRRVATAQSSSAVASLTGDIYELLEREFVCADGKSEPAEQADGEGILTQNDFVAARAKFLTKTGECLGRAVPATELGEILESFCDKSTSARDDFGLMAVKECRRGRADFITRTESTLSLRQNVSALMKSYCERFEGVVSRGKSIDAKKAALMPLGEEDIFKNRSYYEDYKTSVHLLVDVSGSMMTCDNGSESRCEKACVCALSLALALEGISGIKSMASFFPGSSSEVETALKAEEKASVRASYFDQNPRGSTPLAQAVWYALGVALELDCNRNIIIVLTDGIPDSIAQSRLAINAAKDYGIEIYAIGIKLNSIQQIIEDSFVIESASELNRAVSALFKRIFSWADDGVRKTLQ